MLERIQKANDIKNLKKEELPVLAEEIREFLVETVSKTGGHLASNLGVIELTMAMHLVFQMPEDKIIWDVGHQSYTHKILTGRKDGFENLRKYGGTKHAGFGLGFERLIMYVTGVGNIRDVLPFPRTTGSAEF